jgi:hypothetical protein
MLISSHRPPLCNTAMNNPPPGEMMARLITGYWMSQGVYVAAKLELADHIARGTRTVGELASLTNTNADALFRLLRALASIGVFTETEQKTFENTPLSETLRRDVPGSQWAMAVMMCEEHYAN